ncbi:MAG TPA: hypothetical protein VJ796_12300 [Acidimicrobiia bacterium]|nr:hypothetical protein [Acidimicrobiia bacterium]
MHRVGSILVAVAMAACAPAAEVTTTTPSTTTPASSTTSTLEPLVECPPIPYLVSELPTRVTGEAADLGSIELDEFTAIGGTRSVFWVNADGELAIALIRGALPPIDWPGERGEVDVAGTGGVVGPHDDGKWVAAWFDNDGSDRCDRYMMVFYPPVEPFEVESTLRAVTRP